MKKIIELTKKNFKKIINNNKIFIVVFGSQGTPKTTNTLKTLDGLDTDIKIGFVNIEQERELMRDYVVRITPTLIVFLDGFPDNVLNGKKLTARVNTIKEKENISCLMN